MLLTVLSSAMQNFEFEHIIEDESSYVDNIFAFRTIKKLSIE